MLSTRFPTPPPGMAPSDVPAGTTTGFLEGSAPTNGVRGVTLQVVSRLSASRYASDWDAG